MSVEEGQTPRSRQRHDIREKRLRYFTKPLQDVGSVSKSSQRPIPNASQFKGKRSPRQNQNSSTSNTGRQTSSLNDKKDPIRYRNHKSSFSGNLDDEQLVERSHKSFPSDQSSLHISQAWPTDRNVKCSTASWQNKPNRLSFVEKLVTNYDKDLELENADYLYNPEEDLYLETHRPDLDTSRTSDLLLETTRDFKEVLREREELKSLKSTKRSSDQNSTPSYPFDLEKARENVIQNRTRLADIEHNLLENDDAESDYNDEEVKPVHVSTSKLKFDAEPFYPHSSSYESKADYLRQFSSSKCVKLQGVKVALTADKIYEMAKTVSTPVQSEKHSRKSSYEEHLSEVRRFHNDIRRNGDIPSTISPRLESSCELVPNVLNNSTTKAEHSNEACYSLGDVKHRLESVGARFYGDFSPVDLDLNDEGSVTMVKQCPECDSKNEPNISWCMNCGCVLLGIDPEPITTVTNDEKKKTYAEPRDDVVSKMRVTSTNPINTIDVTEPTFEWDYNPGGNYDVVKDYQSMRSNPAHDQASTESDKSAYIVGNVFVSSKMQGPVKEVNPMSSVSPRVSNNKIRIPVASQSIANSSSSFLKESIDSIPSCVSVSEVDSHRPPPPKDLHNELKIQLNESFDTIFDQNSIRASTEDEEDPVNLASSRQHYRHYKGNDSASSVPMDIAVLDTVEVQQLRLDSAASRHSNDVPQLSLYSSKEQDGQRQNSKENRQYGPSSRGRNWKKYRNPNGQRVRNNSDVSHQSPGRDRNDSGRLGQHFDERERTNSGRYDPRVRNLSENGLGDSGVGNGDGQTTYKVLEGEGNHRHPPVVSASNNSRREHSGTGSDRNSQRRWAGSNNQWRGQHPSLLQKKPADYLRQSSRNAHQLLSGNNSPKFLQSDRQQSDRPRSNRVSGDLDHELRSEKPCKQPIEDLVSPSQEVSSVTKETLQQRGWQEGDSPWLYLPDEVWLRILSMLPMSSLAHVSSTCSALRRISGDASLWRRIHLVRRHDLGNDYMGAIGRRRPTELLFHNCHGDDITLQGLKEMFVECGESLRKLGFVSCSRGAFAGDQLLLLSAVYCQNLVEVDASYAQAVRDTTVASLAEASLRLESLHLNGAQNITDEGITALVNYHKNSLIRLELYGCFNLSSAALRVISRCSNLRAISLGSLTKLSSPSIIEMVKKLSKLVSLDMRGAGNHVGDAAIHDIAIHCPLLENLVLANVAKITDASLVSVASSMPLLRVLDCCGCTKVGNKGVEALLRSCPGLEELDVSSTAVDEKGVNYLAKFSSGTLKCLRLNFCRNITEDCLVHLVTSCKKLVSLFLYGIDTIGNVDALCELNPMLVVKLDD